MRTLRACAALLLLLPALTALAPTASAQEVSPSPSPDAVQLSTADNGRTVHLVPGQELVVDLVPPAPGEQWQGPVTAGPVYLTEYTESADRTTARLVALQPSTQPVLLEARTDRSCSHSITACPQGFSEWAVSVVVDPGPVQNPTFQCYSMPTASPGPNVVYIDQKANGQRIRVEEGQLIVLQLRGCDDPYVVPSASGPLFRERADYRLYGVNSTTFRALSQGTSRISSTSDPVCFHTSPPCARPSFPWSVDVEVVAPACEIPAAVTLDPTTIRATEAARVTVRSEGYTPIDLYAYTRPSTTYRLVRSGTTDSNGTAFFAIRPPANTRLYAQQRGCSPGPSVVLNVRTALTLAVERTGVREYVFAGDSLPARTGGLVVSLYRVTTDGRQVLTAQSRADTATGEWRVVRRFTGTGRFGFVARTGQDLQNAPGSSNVRSLLVF